MEPQRTRLAFCIVAALVFFGYGNAFPYSDAAMDRMTDVLLDIDQKLGTIARHFSKGVGGPDECFKGMLYKRVTKFPRIPFMVRENKMTLCDTETYGGGWIVVQRRTNGIENFNRTWNEYKSGFGDVVGEGDFWLGNDVIHQLTTTDKFELILNITLEGRKYESRYSSFFIGDEESSYKMLVSGSSGLIKPMDYNNNTAFTTYDRGSDDVYMNVAKLSGGGWWHRNTGDDNPDMNGLWGRNGTDGINLVSSSMSLRVTFTEMKIRPVS